MHPLIEWLKECQQAERLTDKEFAQKLGIHSRATWTMYKLGNQRTPTFSLLTGALRAYPKHRKTILSLVEEADAHIA